MSDPEAAEPKEVPRRSRFARANDRFWLLWFSYPAWGAAVTWTCLLIGGWIGGGIVGKVIGGLVGLGCAMGWLFSVRSRRVCTECGKRLGWSATPWLKSCPHCGAR